MNNDRKVLIKAQVIEEVYQIVIRKMNWIDANPIVELLKQFEEASVSQSSNITPDQIPSPGPEMPA